MAVRRDQGRWRYRTVVKLPDGRKVRISGTPAVDTTDAARLAERAHVLRVLNPPPPAPQPRKEVPTFGAFAKEYMDGYGAANNKPSHQTNNRSLLSRHLLRFGDVALDAIGVREIDRLKAELARSRNPLTVNNVVGLLVRILRYAVEVELLERAPRIRRLKTMPSPFDFLIFEELDRLCDSAEREPVLLAAVLLGAHAGLRRGELMGLRWEDVDLKASTPQLTVRRSRWQGVVTAPKGGRERKLPLTERLLRALRSVRSLNPGVLCHADGTPWSWRTMRHALPRLCKRAGLRSIGWHSLRHTFCSHLAMRGATPKAIQELAGHADLSTTLRYMHLAPRALVESVRLLDAPAGPAVARTWQSPGEGGEVP